MSLPVASARLVLTLLLGASLAACGTNSTLGSGTTSSREILSFRNTALPEAYANEPYTASVGVSGGVNPYSVRVTSGALPPGLRLSGTSVTGTPTQTGRFEFTLEASDATLSTRSQALAITVSTLPPIALTPTLGANNAANTTFRSDTRVPLRLTAPRGSRALRFSWRLPSGVEVTRVQPGDGTPLLLWKQSPGLLTVVLGFPKEPASGGANVALVSLRFAGPTKLDAAQVGLEARDATGKMIAEAALPPVTPPASGTPTGTAPATGASPTATPPSTPGATAPDTAAAASATTPEVAGPPAPATSEATNPPPPEASETPAEPGPATAETPQASTPETNESAPPSGEAPNAAEPPDATTEPSGTEAEGTAPADQEPPATETTPAETPPQGESAAPATTPEAAPTAPTATAPSSTATAETPTTAAPAATDAAKTTEPKALDLGDFAVLAVNFGRTGENLPGDLDKNGKVDAADVRLFSERYPLP